MIDSPTNEVLTSPDFLLYGIEAFNSNLVISVQSKWFRIEWSGGRWINYEWSYPIRARWRSLKLKPTISKIGIGKFNTKDWTSICGIRKNNINHKAS